MEHALYEEEPPPARFIQNAAHVQDAKGEEAHEDATHIRRHPEEGKTDGQLRLGIEVW